MIDGVKVFSTQDCRKRAMEYDRHARYQEYLDLYARILDKAGDKSKA